MYREERQRRYRLNRGHACSLFAEARSQGASTEHFSAVVVVVVVVVVVEA